MAVAGALALRTVRMPDGHLVLDKAFELYSVFHDWIELEEILKTFFFTPSILRHWHKVWKEGKQRQEHLQRIEQSRPSCLFVHDLPAEEQPLAKEPTPEQIRTHVRAIPGEMMKMMNAAQCPFAARMAQKAQKQQAVQLPTMQGTNDFLMAGTSPI